MASFKALDVLARRTIYSAGSSKRLLHQSSARHAITNLEMPAMSPTMTEGGISSWKKRDGEAFSAGDVLLEIETDKATIDVEAQEDGIMGKIFLPDGSKNIPVGKVIALLAEEGDDISNLQPPKDKESVPKKEAAASPPPPPEPVKLAHTDSSAPSTSHSHTPAIVSHSRPIFPSVHRLLQEYNVTNAESIKGTGIRGMLTKGDVLAHLGKASSPTGTYKQPSAQLPETQGVKKEKEVKPLDGASIRRLIVSTMLKDSIAARSIKPSPIDFDWIIADYLPRSVPTPKIVPSHPPAPKSTADFFDGLY
ncbi:hypothetical protein H0H81_010664 [Sphagnurus paluster]|uniref:Single hybrid motif-containing protein n=1 Tax=Sphagnurus paluster TaxID=117069 RepID=A0A9P7GKE3_9AGAR|nr:hypothetical protein H0H81_010664 [Sphagnurus paluster]